MTTVFFDPDFTDEQRRRALYGGALIVLSPRPSSLALCAFGRQLIESAFAPLDPRQAQFQVTIDRFRSIVSDLRYTFTQHPKSRACLRDILDELGCDPEQTYFDVPRLRGVASDGFLTPWGRKFLLHPHRDTWYAAPSCEVNWWIPIYEIAPENCLAFHPNYWRRAVRNGSAAYNHAEWMDEETFKVIDREIKAGTRRHPIPEEPLELEPQLRLVCPPGGILLFSGAQLHSSVPNTSGWTRFSFDFRTAHLDDARAGRGAPNVDAEASGTALAEFVRGADFAPFPDDVAVLHRAGTPIERAPEPAPA